VPTPEAPLAAPSEPVAPVSADASATTAAESDDLPHVGG
jgi:hypothetical protein